jgi:DNA sulfur modification protein DndB
MSVTLPVLKATMGSRKYYISKMSAAELSGQVAVASELTGWDELSLNELYQRKLNEKRVEQDIAPYLARTKGRFFGSLIVWIMNREVVTFESVSDQVSVPAAYSAAARSMGFLVIDASRSGQQSGLVALDGQHRLAALRSVVQGRTEGPEAANVRDDEVAVIFVQDDNVASARDLFTVLNRSARRVSKSDVLIMSEVDGAAIIARELTVGKILAPKGIDKDPLVKWEKNTISGRDPEMTTLNAIYEIVQLVAEFLGVDLQAGEEAGNPPSDDDMATVRAETERWLVELFGRSPDFAAMQYEPLKVIEMRKEGPYSLLMKPVGLIAFFSAVVAALDPSGGRQTDAGEVIDRLLQFDWDIKSTFWKGIMVNSRGNITNKKSDIQLAGDLAAWMVTGKSSSTQFQESLVERYRRQLGRRDSSLPNAKFDR